VGTIPGTRNTLAANFVGRSSALSVEWARVVAQVEFVRCKFLTPRNNSQYVFASGRSCYDAVHGVGTCINSGTGHSARGVA
jgi:hypothetical protein